MIVAIACDHRGLDLKESVIRQLEQLGLKVLDKGAFTEEAVDYPDLAKEVCLAVSSGEAQKGILICGTGIGMSIAANKVSGIRAALCNDLFSAAYSRLHNDANVLCLGKSILGEALASEIVKIWFETAFEGGRHERRVNKIADLEKE